MKHVPRFEFYQCTVGDRPASIRVDVGRHDAGPDAEFPHSLTVRVTLRDVREDGLTTRTEAALLSQFEDALVQALAPAPWVGVLTNSGRRNWYFYAADPTSAAARTREVGDRLLPRHSVVAESFEDPEWAQYFQFLYPNDLAWQWIQDFHTLEVFAKDGDDGSAPRPVDHWAFFGREEDQQNFRDAVVALGYVVVALWKKEEDGDEPFAIQFRTATDEPIRDMFPRTERLAIVAREHGGTYDGWEAEVR